MAQTLEKNFLQKIKDMPPVEFEIDPPTIKKGKKMPRAPTTMTRRQTAEALVSSI